MPGPRYGNLLGAIIVATASSNAPGPAEAVYGGVTTDAWDCTAGVEITDSSGGHSPAFALPNIFRGGVGTSDCGTDGQEAIFRDGEPAGTVHFVEWQVPTPVEITSFNLSAAHDGHEGAPAACGLQFRDARHRGFDRFTLKAFNTGSGQFEVLYDAIIPLGSDNGDHPDEDAQLYDPTGVLGPTKNNLDITANVDPVPTNRWRAEFVQVGCSSNASGPRITELDGFAAPPDADGDGVPAAADACPSSDLSPTVVIDGCDSGVDNALDDDGCTIADRSAECAADASSHHRFVSCVGHLTRDLRKHGVIRPSEEAAIRDCAAQADLPKGLKSLPKF